MSGTITIHLRGRLGNQMMQYAFARAYAERVGAYFITAPWIGERIFQLERLPYPVDGLGPLNIRDEANANGETNILFQTYAQSQAAMIYTRTQFRQWFTFRPEIKATLERLMPVPDHCCAHRRVGDFPKHGYPTVSKKSYEHFALLFGIPSITWITEEQPTLFKEYLGEMFMLPDFFRLTRCQILLRGNSTFSWCAGHLNTQGEVYSPIIEGLPDGQDNFCQFVAGNHPRLANLANVTSLTLQP